jgi:hypothetical protein
LFRLTAPLSIAEVSLIAVAPPVVAGSAPAPAIDADAAAIAATHEIGPPRRMKPRADLIA